MLDHAVRELKAEDPYEAYNEFIKEDKNPIQKPSTTLS